MPLLVEQGVVRVVARVDADIGRPEYRIVGIELGKRFSTNEGQAGILGIRLQRFRLEILTQLLPHGTLPSREWVAASARPVQCLC